jgi:predicted MPP superfamily phosphohydrolase
VLLDSSLTSVALLVALLGHAFLWIGFVNRIHGAAWPYRLVDVLMVFGMACLVLIPAAYVLWLPAAGMGLRGGAGLLGSGLPYLVICWIAAAVNLAAWTWRHVLHCPPAVLRGERVWRMELPQAPADAPEHRHSILARIPGNEILRMEMVERRLEIPHLGPRLHGLSIVHLSDLHFTGWIGRGFFQHVAEWTNDLEPDLVAITGDLIDNPDCIDWLPDTVGRLSARYGVYFVLGNHDSRRGRDRIRQTLIDCGMVALGGRWVEAAAGPESILLAGNELPWIPPAADMTGAPPPLVEGGPLRVLLSHSPDQLRWAQHHHFDLMLAGHTHGGQICFPMIGPILTPSRVGVRYASGVFHEPPTILHVTRGVSAEFPVRWLCPPEIDRLVLCSPAEAEKPRC